MPPPRLYDPNDLLAAGYNGLRGSYAKACRALGWPVKNAYGAKHAADRTIASARPPTDGPEPATMPAFSLPAEPTVPRSPEPAIQIARLDWDRLLVLTDLHVPYHSGDMLERALRLASRRGIQHAVLGGDLIDSYQWARRNRDRRSERTYQDDLILLRDVMHELARWIPNIYALAGNHDAWAENALKGQVKPEWLLGEIMRGVGEHVTWSDIQQVRVMSAGRRFRITHGANYSSVNPLGVAVRLAQKWQESVVMGHQHHAVEGMYGDYQCIVLGGCYDPTRMEYLHKAPRTNPVPTRSIGLIDRGWCQVFRPEDASW
jgi:predicted phosphodiesterase